MDSRSVTVDRTVSPALITFAPGFNVAVPFIDRPEGGHGGESDGLASELMQICKTQLDPYEFPRLIHFVQELPKTATGMIQRFRLRQLAPAPLPATGTGR